MKCLGRTKLFSRCKNNGQKWYLPVCKHHKTQFILFFVITIPAFVGTIAGLYRDVIEPIFKVDEVQIEKQQLEEIKINQDLLKKISSKLDNDEQMVDFWKNKYFETYRELEKLKMLQGQEKDEVLKNMYNGNFEVIQNILFVYLNQSLEDPKFKSKIFYEIANLHLLELDFNSARNSYLKSLEMNDLNQESLKSLILIDFHLGDLDSSQKNIEKLLKTSKNDLVIDEFSANFQSYPCRNNKYDIQWIYADILRQKSKFKDAEIIIRKLISSKEKFNISDTCEYALLFSELGLIQFESGDNSRAEFNYLQSLKLDANIIILNNLGDFYLSINKFDIAKKYLTESYLKRKRDLGNSHLQTGFAANRLGEYYRRVKMYKESLYYFNEALAIYKSNISENHYYYPVLYNNLSLTLVSLGNFNEAERLLMIGLKINKDLYGEQSSHLSLNYYNLADLKYKQSQNKALTTEEKITLLEYAKKYINASLFITPNDSLSLRLKKTISEQLE